jgi:hypothetical protein
MAFWIKNFPIVRVKKVREIGELLQMPLSKKSILRQAFLFNGGFWPMTFLRQIPHLGCAALWICWTFDIFAKPEKYRSQLS